MIEQESCLDQRSNYKKLQLYMHALSFTKHIQHTNMLHIDMHLLQCIIPLHTELHPAQNIYRSRLPKLGNNGELLCKKNIKPCMLINL